MEKADSEEGGASQPRNDHVTCLQDLWKILENEFKSPSLTELDTSCVAETMTILMGNTRCGKSTIRMLLTSESNYENLIAVGDIPRIQEQDVAGKEIGNSSGYSCTTAPKIFQVAEKPGTIFVDMPGMGDNRGTFHEIVGVHLLNQVVNKAKKLNFLLVIPFQAFHDDGDRRCRTGPLEFVSQIVRHVSTPASVGLVVTKVDNYEPFTDDDKVKLRILTSLKALKIEINSTTNSNESRGLDASVLDSLIERESVFLIRRPQKPDDVEFILISQIPDGSIGKQYYAHMCREFIKFCDELETAEKSSLFTATPSETTKYKLIQKIFPHITAHISGETNSLLTELQEISNDQVKSLSTNKTGRIVLLSMLAEALEKIAQFCNQSGRNFINSSTFINELADIFKTDHFQGKLYTLQAFEKEFSALQSITGIEYTGKSPNISSLRNHLEKLHKTLIGENKGLMTDLEDWVTNETKGHVTIITTKYMKRFRTMKTSTVNCHLAAKQLDMHLSRLNMSLRENNDSISINSLYDVLTLIVSKQERDEFHQLNVATKQLCNVGRTVNSCNEIFTRVKDFLKDLRSTMPTDFDNIQDRINNFRSNVSTTLASIEQSFFKEINENISTAKIPSVIYLLEKITAKIKTHQVQLKQKTMAINLFEEIYKFFTRLNVGSTDHSVQFTHAHWQDADMPVDALLISWQNFVSRLNEQLEVLTKVYKFIQYAVVFSSTSLEFIQKIRNLHLEDISLNQVPPLVFQAGTTINGFTPDICPNFVNNIFTSKLYLNQQKLLMNFIQKIRSIPNTFHIGNSLLILNETNIILSDLIDKYGQLRTSSSSCEREYVISLTNGTFFVDTDYIAGDIVKVQNLFIVCSQVECDGQRCIKLDGKHDQPIPLTTAASGATLDSKGENGQNVHNGGNIYLLTKKPVDSAHHVIMHNMYLKMGLCFTEFDILFTLFCNTVECQLPNLDNLKVTLEDIYKTPSEQLFVKTQQRLKLCFLTIAVLRFIAKKPKDHCICTCFLATRLTCEYVLGVEDISSWFLYARNLPLCTRSSGGSVCPFDSYMNSEQRNRFSSVWSLAEYRVQHLSNELRTFIRKVHSFEDATAKYLLDLSVKAKELLQYICKIVTGGISRRMDMQGYIFKKHPLQQTTIAEELARILQLPRLFPVVQHEQYSVIEVKELTGQCDGNGGHGRLNKSPGTIICLSGLFCGYSHELSCNCGTDGSDGQHIEEGRRIASESKLPQGLFPNRDENSHQSAEFCPGICKVTWKECNIEIGKYLRNCVMEFDKIQQRVVISTLAEYDWAMKYVLTLTMLADEYLCLSRNVLDYDADRCHKNNHLNRKVEYQERLEEFRNMNELSEGEDLAAKLILSCNAHHMSCIKLHQVSQPLILNLSKYLQASSQTIKCFEETKISLQVSNNYKRFQDRIEERIIEKKNIMNEAISSFFKNIEDWFKDQQKRCKEDVAGLIEVLERHSYYEMVANICQSISTIMSFIGTNSIVRRVIGEVWAGRILLASNGLACLVPYIKPSPLSVPDGITAHISVNNLRVKKASIRSVEGYISILKGAIEGRQELNTIFSKILENLHEVKEKLADCSVTESNIKAIVFGTNDQFWNCLLNLENIRKELFHIINKKLDTIGENHELFPILEKLCFDLCADDHNWEVYSRPKESFLEAARYRKKSVDERFVPAVDRFLAKVKRDLGKDLGISKWKLKDLILEMKEYLKTFMEGLPSMKSLETGFNKIDLALEMYINLWDDIEKENDKKEWAELVSPGKGILDQFGDVKIEPGLENIVIKIICLTRAQLLLHEYKQIENGFLQWAFPYGKKYMEAVLKQVEEIRALCSDKDEIDTYDVIAAATECREVVEYLTKTYPKNLSEKTSEDVVWVTHYFSGISEDLPFFEWNHEEHYDQIRRLLLGFPTKFLADVRKCPLGRGAIKVKKTIELRFCFSERSQADYQEELNILLKKLLIEMTHSGDSYYKVDSKYFCIRGEEICLLGNVETKKYKNKLTENDSRAKMEDFVLSPYTEWTFKLRLAHPEPNNDQHFFAQLADKFSHCVDLQLVGDGRFLDEVGSVWKNNVEIRPKDVEYYYERVEVNDDTNISSQTDKNPHETTSSEISSLCRKTIVGQKRDDILCNAADNSHPQQIKSKVGFPKFTNSCYINSTIQCLGHTSKLVDNVLCQPILKNPSLHKCELWEKINKIVIQMTNGDASSLIDLKDFVGKRHANFKSFDQQDAHEFLTILLSLLHDEVNAISREMDSKIKHQTEASTVMDAMKAYDEYEKLNNSKIVELFCGQQKSQVKCSKCRESSVTFETFFILSLPIPSCDANNSLSIWNCLKYYLAEEEVTGWDCPHCKIKVNATKKTDFCRLPYYLILHLKRFEKNEGWEKRENKIDFPVDELTLTSKKECDERNEPENNTYRLYSVTNHYGSMNSGHYTAFCRDKDDESWWKFDEQEVSQLEANDVSTAAGYILFYQLQS